MMKRFNFLLIQIICFLGLCALIDARSSRTSIIPGSKIKVALPYSEEKIQNILTQSALLNEYKCKNLIVRGGSDEESDGYDDEDEEEPSEVLSTAIDLSKKSIAMVGKITIQAFKAIKRAIKAGLEGDEDEEEQGRGRQGRGVSSRAAPGQGRR